MLLTYFFIAIAFSLHILNAAPSPDFQSAAGLNGQQAKRQAETGDNFRSAPTSVDRSDAALSCPAGHQLFGKHCAKSIVEAPELTCNVGYSLTPDNTCIRYTSKQSDCPAGFTNNDGICRRYKQAPKVPACPSGYLMHPDDTRCTRTVEMPDTQVCPAGAVQQGDLCIVERTAAPINSCPEGFTLEGTQCRIEELYNCTPDLPVEVQMLRQGALRNVGKDQQVNTLLLNPTVSPGNTQNSAMQSQSLRRLHPTPVERPPTLHDDVTRTQESPVLDQNTTQSSSTLRKLGVRSPFKKPSTAASQSNLENYFSRAQRTRTQESGIVTIEPPQDKNAQPLSGTAPASTQSVPLPRPPAAQDRRTFYQDYVVQSTCSRVRVVAALKVCEEGVLDGKVCAIDEQVNSITTYGGVAEDNVPAIAECPPSYSPSNTDPLTCTAVDEVPATFFCVAGTTDLGDRCAQQSNPRKVCNEGFALEEDMCVQTQLSEPLVEFTVKYTCVGKNCEDAS